jgi:2-methylcitrate dehydratase PrpD
MTQQTANLAAFAANLCFEDIPSSVIDVAKACLVDTVGAALFGSRLPWSGYVGDYVRMNGGTGRSTVLGAGLPSSSASAAALANGAAAHAFEFDSLRQPSIGVHPGSTALVAALAVAQETGAQGRDLLAAFVAGCECMFRIALAAKSSSEKLGFHAPGITGVFGAAIACGRLLGLDAERMVRAIGIGGSLGSGILAFAKAGNGGMVKRLHMGRAAEGGVLAAGLAQRGFEGPDNVLEGKFGYLDVYARNGDPTLLDAELGDRWETLTTSFKIFPCHVTAQAPIRALLDLQKLHGFGAEDVAGCSLQASEKVLSHHSDPMPQDIATAQYSVPYCLAVTLFRDPGDPESFLTPPDPSSAIAAMSQKIRLELNAETKGDDRAFQLAVLLRDGRELITTGSRGTEAQALPTALLKEKFLKLAGLPMAESKALYDRLMGVEQEAVSNLFLR